MNQEAKHYLRLAYDAIGSLLETATHDDLAKIESARLHLTAAAQAIKSTPMTNEQLNRYAQAAKDLAQHGERQAPKDKTG